MRRNAQETFFRVRDVTRACASGVTGAPQEGGWSAGEEKKRMKNLVWQVLS